jgi:hypothetical protein
MARVENKEFFSCSAHFSSSFLTPMPTHKTVYCISLCYYFALRLAAYRAYILSRSSELLFAITFSLMVGSNPNSTVSESNRNSALSSYNPLVKSPSLMPEDPSTAPEGLPSYMTLLRPCCIRCAKQYSKNEFLRCVHPAEEQKCSRCTTLHQGCMPISTMTRPYKLIVLIFIDPT